MGSRLPSITPRQIERILLAKGFIERPSSDSGELGKTPYQFTGERYDATGRTTHHSARDYASAARVWLQTDQYMDPEKDKWLATSPENQNRTQYASANPISSFDPNGHHTCRAFGTGGTGGWHVQARKKKEPNKGEPTKYMFYGAVQCSGPMSQQLQICVQKGNGAGGLTGSPYGCGTRRYVTGITNNAQSRTIKCNSTNTFAGIFHYYASVQIGNTTHVVQSPPGGAIRSQRFLTCAY